MNEWNNETDAIDGQALPAEPSSALVDHLFLDALLRRVHQSDVVRDGELVSQALGRISDERVAVAAAPVDARTGRRRWLVSSLTTAAGVGALAGGWLLLAARPLSAQAAVERALTDADRPLDRHFVIRTQLGGLANDELIESDLYVRGGDRLALRHPGPMGANFWLGRDGRQSWLVPPIGPVLVSDDSSAIGGFIKDHRLLLPYPNVATVLQMMARQHDLETKPDESLPGRTGRYHHIQARRQQKIGLVPQTIDLWIEPDTHAVVRLTLEWGGVAKFAEKLVERIEFDLVDETPRPLSWHTHADHHAPERPVLQF